MGGRCEGGDGGGDDFFLGDEGGGGEGSVTSLLVETKVTRNWDEEETHGQPPLAIFASASTTSSVLGHFRPAGASAGLWCRYVVVCPKMNFHMPSGKHSLSKTAACNSWPKLRGISIQLPHHHGLSLGLPLLSLPHSAPASSAAFHPNSRARKSANTATDIRSCCAG